MARASLTSQIRYARSGDVHIAYRTLGGGPIDLVSVAGWISNIEAMWEEPSLARFMDRLASFSRLIVFDKRGTGLSDRVPTDQLPTLEQRMDDVRAVLDAVGSRQAALFGWSEGGPMSILYAATYPDRTRALVLYGTYPKRVWSTDYPWAPKPAERQRWYDSIERDWGGDVDLRELGRFRGRELDTAGDGFLAAFDGPARAVRCAAAVRHRLAALSLTVRAGLHTGEVQLHDDKVAGIAVHVAARIGSLAAGGQILSSSTVRDLVAGSGIGFEDRGEHELKGIADRWRLYEVTAT